MRNISENPKYLIYRDLIGLKIWIKQIGNKKKTEFFPGGIVIDESYNTLITTTEKDPKNYEKNQKVYLKKKCIFRFELPAESEKIIVEINGEKIQKRPENRIKLLRKKKRRR